MTYSAVLSFSLFKFFPLPKIAISFGSVCPIPRQPRFPQVRFLQHTKTAPRLQDLFYAEFRSTGRLFFLPSSVIATASKIFHSVRFSIFIQSDFPFSFSRIFQLPADEAHAAAFLAPHDTKAPRFQP